MPKLDASQVQCQVLTYKEGLLSAVAHDLKLAVTKLSIEFDPDSKKIDATFDPTSLTVHCAMKDGEERLDTLSAKDKRDIEGNIAKDVLVTKKHREIRFRSKSVSESGGVYRVSGTLEIKGKARDVSFDLRNSGDNLEAKVRLHQPDYGVKPYSAMLGALKIKPDIDVLVKLPKKLVG
jgi:polyisoprenoid-binding protein YceI